MAKWQMAKNQTDVHDMGVFRNTPKYFSGSFFTICPNVNPTTPVHLLELSIFI